MRRRSLLQTGLLLGATPLIAALTSERAWADQVDDVLARITKARADIKTLQAPFDQVRKIGLLATEVESEGKLTMVRPDRLRWDLLPPDSVTYWIGPEGLAMADADGVTKVPKASAKRFAAVLGDLMVMLGGDIGTLRKRYAFAVSEEGGVVTLVAKPTDEAVAKHIAKLVLRAEGDKMLVKHVGIHEKSGDQSLIDFGAFSLNEKIPPERMRPPKS